MAKQRGEIVLPPASKRERERVEWVDENDDDGDDGDDDIIIIC